MNLAEKIAIVGAGMAGCVLARTLHDAGFEVTVFEKSGGSGGRLSTRRTDFGSFDHGAQYIKAKAPSFRAMMTGLANAGSVSIWDAGDNDSGDHWHMGASGMSDVVKPLLVGVKVLKRQQVIAVAPVGDGFEVSIEDGEGGLFDRVLVTVPLPQAVALVGGLDTCFDALRTVEYLPCFSVMAAYERPLQTVPDTFRGGHLDAVGWLARENAKRTGGAERLTIHAGGQWSAVHVDDDRAVVAEMMMDAFSKRFDVKVKPVHLDVHRWLYAFPAQPYGQAFLSGCDDRIVLVGDGFLGGKVEAAFESARQTADFIKSKIANA